MSDLPDPASDSDRWFEALAPADDATLLRALRSWLSAYSRASRQLAECVLGYTKAIRVGLKGKANAAERVILAAENLVGVLGCPDPIACVGDDVRDRLQPALTELSDITRELAERVSHEYPEDTLDRWLAAATLAKAELK